MKEDRKRSRSGSPVSGAEKKKKRSRSRSGSKEERRREEKKMKKHKHRDRSRSRERHREKDKHKKGSMDGFIVDEEEERKKRLKKLMREGMVNVDDDGGVTIGQERGKAFPSQGLVVTHDNLNGPQCPKCDQICKDNANLKNHVLSHYYQDFYRVTPDTKPYACPTCGKENRDRITMIRHFAFSHNMLYELTDMTPEMLNTTRGGGGLGPQGRGPVNKTPNKQDKRLANKSDSEDDDEKFRKRMAALANKNDKNSTEVKTTFGKHEHKHKKEKKEKKHKEHRDHKETEEERRIRKEKKRAEKEKEREKERRGSKEGSSNPLGSMMKEISPADSPQEPVWTFQSQAAQPGGEVVLTIADELKRARAIAEIEGETFVQSDFRTEHLAKLQGKEAKVEGERFDFGTSAEAGQVKDAGLAHPKLFGDQAKREKRFLQTVFALRQAALAEGD